MAFDPDKYLASKEETPFEEPKGFDPDKYLAKVDPTSKTESALRGLAQGASLGFADEIAGGAEATWDKLTGKEKLDFIDLYKKRRDESRANFKRAKESNPTTFNAGEIGGGLATALVPGVGAVGSIGKMAATGAALGGLGGLGSSEADNALDMAIDTGVGAGVGGVLGGGFGALGKAPKYLAKITPEMAEKAGGMTGATIGGNLGAIGGSIGTQVGSKIGETAGKNLGRGAGNVLQRLSKIGQKIPPKVEAELGEIIPEGAPANLISHEAEALPSRYGANPAVEADLGPIVPGKAPRNMVSKQAEALEAAKPNHIDADIGPVIPETAPHGFLSSEIESLASPNANDPILKALTEYKNKFDFSKLSGGSKNERSLDTLIQKLQSTPFENLSNADKYSIMRRVGDKNGKFTNELVSPQVAQNNFIKGN